MALSVPPAAGTSRSSCELRDATAETTSADSSRKRSNVPWSRTTSCAVAAACESAGFRTCTPALNSRPAGSEKAVPRPRTALLRSPRVRWSSVLSTVSRSTSDCVSSAGIVPPSAIFGALLGPGVSDT
jgi:hypothetical protein